LHFYLCGCFLCALSRHEQHVLCVVSMEASTISIQYTMTGEMVSMP
jgi:hypothetical protein